MDIRIHQLSAIVANQIAAGEVIERPASVVKELLENSLDAQANSIHIEINFGGLNQIKISDNGIGIVADDLHLAITAHATSKINKLQDLYAIRSMGFRGEALASIASISRMTLSSKPASQEHAMMIHVDGSAGTLSPCARSQGTTIDVRDLFYNAPVRKKFLKSERTEFQAIEAVVRRFALSAPDIALTLNHNGKTLMALPGAVCEQTRLQRIQKLLGRAFIEQAVHLDIERAGVHLHGWISSTSYQRSQNDKQWVYINQRMVKDKLLNHAIKQAYEGLLHPGRYPSCLLYLTMSAAEVDVNVHPTKHEVRFQQPRLVHDLIASQLIQALAEPPTITPALLVSNNPPAALEVREAYVKHSFAAELVKSSASTGPARAKAWVILNSHFALLRLNDQSFLVDVEQLQHRRLFFHFNSQPLPLASRPLLVPVSYPITKVNSQLIEHYQPKLAQLGMEIALGSELQVMVRSLPLLLPQLDLRQFMQQLDKKANLELPDLIKLLVMSQTVDAALLSVTEQDELTDYFQQELQRAGPSKPWCLPLDLSNCRDVMHV